MVPARDPGTWHPGTRHGPGTVASAPPQAKQASKADPDAVLKVVICYYFVPHISFVFLENRATKGPLEGLWGHLTSDFPGQNGLK